jgi:hypothetical protein
MTCPICCFDDDEVLRKCDICQMAWCMTCDIKLAKKDYICPGCRYTLKHPPHKSRKYRKRKQVYTVQITQRRRMTDAEYLANWDTDDSPPLSPEYRPAQDFYDYIAPTAMVTRSIFK